MKFVLTPFTVVPDTCSITYSCTNVRRIDKQIASLIQCSDLNFDGIFDDELTDGTSTFSADKDDYIVGKYVPGIYEVTITGFAGSVNRVSESSTYIITLLDACDPPEKIEVPDPLENQVYILGDTEAPPYTHPDFKAVPDFCGLEYSYTITKLENASPDSAITRNGKTFSFEYLTDLEPLNQEQIVTVTAKSKTLYDQNQEPAEISE